MWNDLIFKVDQLSEFITPKNTRELVYICDWAGIEGVSTLRLYNDTKRFTFSESAISSYLGYGSYMVENEELILKTDDGLYTYKFEIVDDSLLYQEKYVYRKVIGKW